MSLTVSLYEYPIKGGRGMRRDVMTLDRRGPTLDRRWMVVDHSGEKITQRECPQLARLCVRGFGVIGPHSMATLWFDGAAVERLDDMKLMLEYPGKVVTVNVWGDPCEAVRSSKLVDQWLSQKLGREVWLVRMKNDFKRPSRGNRLGEGTVLNGFADGYPLLITTQASLAELNRRLEYPVPMNRFRPSIVIHGDLAPFAEDRLEGKLLRIGGVNIRVRKPCARCVVITTDQKTGQRMMGEPLKTLATFRKFGNKVRFGMNADHLNEGVINAGDIVDFID